MTVTAYVGAAIFHENGLHDNCALVLDAGVFRAIVPVAEIGELRRVEVAGGTLLPGFVDLQTNGGGGVMFNDSPSVDTLRAMAAAHGKTGTAAFLPTLITDTREHSHAAIASVVAAIAEGVPGVIGLHLEGPHLSQARKGAHDPALIRPMEGADLQMMLAAAAQLPNLLMTLAPESVTSAQVEALVRAGVIVSLGHSDCSYETAMAFFSAGAGMATHLFNAMSQFGNRAPGLVGAVLDAGGVSAGVIADAIHVHPAAMRAALAAKRGPGRLFLVTDSMATLGSDITGFTLNGRQILRQAGRLTLANGSLAGADLEMAGAIRVLVEAVGIPLAQALEMATSGPAGLLRDAMGFGTFQSGSTAHAIHLSSDYRVSHLVG